MKMKKVLLACVVALAISPVATATDIAISTQAGWFGQAAADREMQEIVDNVTGATIEQFRPDQQDALADWVVAHTGDGVSDILILCGQFPDTIYPAGNAEPDGSIAELFLDDGNTIINTGDYMFYVCSAGNNAAGGLENMMDIPGISMWDDNTPVAVTGEGAAVTRSLQDFQTDRPFHLDELEGDWVPELILAQNDAGTRADPVIVLNTATGGRLGIFYQTAGQDNDPRGEVISEWINNFVLTGGVIPNGPAWKPNPADGAVDVTSPLFEWTAGYGAVSHDVYLGTSPDLTDADFKVSQPFTMYFHTGVLEPGVTYYWRIDEGAADGSVVVGDVWSFTVFPVKATEPSPADGVEYVPLAPTLSWKAGNGAESHDVYLGTDEAAVAAGDASVLLGNVGEAHYHVAALELETTYYWRVDEIDALGGVVVGDVWSFTTLGAIENPIVEPNLIGIWTFDTEAQNSPVAFDMTGNNRHGMVVGNITFETDALMGQVISLPGGDDQYVNIGAVGLSGNDATTIACWAKADNTSIPDWTLIFGFTGTADGAGGNGSHFNIGSLGGPGGVGAHVWGWEETIFSDNESLEWHHYAMTYDGTTITYYGDGIEMDTDVDKSNERDLSIRGDRVHIGSRVTQASSFPGDVDDCRVYDRVLTGDEIRALVLDRMAVPVVGPVGPADITSPRDLVIGVPDDGDWPDGETPLLAVDNSANRKFLHFKGFSEPTGIQVTPLVGETVVIGITLTTANDAPERDPVAYELSGSNDGIEWTVIAAGDIVDFAGEEAWPRFTQNETPIEFANDVPYMHYQLLFTAVRDPGAANSMQIGEVELLGEAVGYVEDFEAYEAGSDLHGQGGWKGWDNTAGAGAPVSSAQAFSGANSAEIIGSADLVREFSLAGGIWTFSTMQYIPSGTTGQTYFILLNTYNDGGPYDWSVQLNFNLDTGVVTSENLGSGTANIVYDQWVELACVIDLDNNTVDEYYNGVLVSSHQWDDNASGTLGAIDLFGNGASSVFYDDVTIAP
jgi:hypothetical protein